MPYIPRNIGEVVDQLSLMATRAPRYEQTYNPDGDPEGEFAATRGGLANIRSQIGERSYAYLLARIEENWMRLQSGDLEDLKQLKLSFGEMAHFVRSKKYQAENLTDELAMHTKIR